MIVQNLVNFIRCNNLILLLNIAEETIVTTDTNCGIDIYDILNSAIGAFFGAFLGILTSLIMKLLEEKKSIKISINNITEELNDIYVNLQNNDNENRIAVKDNEKISLRYDIPVWEAIIKSQYLFYFQKKSYYKELTQVYATIKYCQELEKNGGEKEEIIYQRNILYKQLQDLSKHSDLKNIKEDN